MNRIMLDLETLGTAPGSVILSIGAVRFDLDGLKDEFQVFIAPESAQEFGLTLDSSTAMWWMGQSQEARERQLKAPNRLPLDEALAMFGAWSVAPVDAKGVPVDELWGNGSDFDNVLLAAAFEKAGVLPSWRYSKNRCYRTMRAMFPDVPFTPPVVAHDALEDAKAQATHLVEILKKIS